MKYSVLLITFLFVACSGGLVPGELIAWIDKPENGCTQTIEQQGFKLKASILPASLMTYKQFHILEEHYDDSSFEAVENEFKKGRYFKFALDFEGNSQNAKQFFEEHTDYLNFFISRDLALVKGTDTVLCSMANLERSANFSPKLSYELAFDTGLKEEENQDMILIYSGELSNNKPVEFVFSAQSLNDIPHLKR